MEICYIYIYILLLQGYDGDMFYIYIYIYIYILLLQGSDGDMLYIYCYCRVLMEICYIYIVTAGL